MEFKKYHTIQGFCCKMYYTVGGFTFLKSEQCVPWGQGLASE